MSQQIDIEWLDGKVKTYTAIAWYSMRTLHDVLNKQGRRIGVREEESNVLTVRADHATTIIPMDSVRAITIRGQAE